MYYIGVDLTHPLSPFQHVTERKYPYVEKISDTVQITFSKLKSGQINMKIETIKKEKKNVR